LKHKINVLQGTNITLSCSAESRPYPHVKWYHNEKDISSLQQSDAVSNNSITSLLYIPSVSDIDVGKYKCFSWNDFGNDSYTTDMDIQGKEIIVFHSE